MTENDWRCDEARVGWLCVLVLSVASRSFDADRESPSSLGGDFLALLSALKSRVLESLKVTKDGRSPSTRNRGRGPSPAGNLVTVWVEQRLGLARVTS